MFENVKRKASSTVAAVTPSTTSTMTETLRTPLTELLGIKVPIILAGMARTSGGPLAAAVSNAGGLGVIGGLGYTPAQLQEVSSLSFDMKSKDELTGLKIIDELKSNLTDKSLPFGVDLALPKVGEGARKTNHDYTHGQLDDLITVTIKNGAKLFVSAVGIPPPHVSNTLTHGPYSDLAGLLRVQELILYLGHQTPPRSRHPDNEHGRSSQTCRVRL
jgi:NAD(P)H-dependent flavin oxidoreductase YrpB (nitropropane dioxygenase family)